MAYQKNNYNNTSVTNVAFVKKSGCKMHMRNNQDGSVQMFLTAWKVDKTNGMINMIASPRVQGGSETRNPNQSRFTCKITFVNSMRKPELFTGFYNHSTKKLTIPDLQLVANPNAPNGGYFGRNYKRK